MIHTAIETCGCIPFTHYEKVLPYLDWIFFDLKHMDDALHREKTGKSNRLILKNALKLATQFTGRLIFRMPVIKGFNDNKVHILQLATFIRKTGKNEINILPLHHLGREKYAMLGKEYRASQMEIPTQEEMENIQAWFTAEGIRCYIGSNTPF
jgi:pyruvate formate lyase activating enzyme